MDTLRSHISGTRVPGASRVKGVHSLLAMLRRVRLRADRLAAYRQLTDEQRRFCLQCADVVEQQLKKAPIPYRQKTAGSKVWERRTAQAFDAPPER